MGERAGYVGVGRRKAGRNSKGQEKQRFGEGPGAARRTARKGEKTKAGEGRAQGRGEGIYMFEFELYPNR